MKRIKSLISFYDTEGCYYCCLLYSCCCHTNQVYCQDNRNNNSNTKTNSNIPISSNDLIGCHIKPFETSQRRRTTTTTTRTKTRKRVTRKFSSSHYNLRLHHRLASSLPPSMLTLSFYCSLLLITVLLSVVNCVVVHQVRFIESKTGRTDYALTGETIELSCHYMMKDEAEDVKQLIWSKDGKNVPSV